MTAVAILNVGGGNAVQQQAFSTRTCRFLMPCRIDQNMPLLA